MKYRTIEEIMLEAVEENGSLGIYGVVAKINAGALVAKQFSKGVKFTEYTKVMTVDVSDSIAGKINRGIIRARVGNNNNIQLVLCE